MSDNTFTYNWKTVQSTVNKLSIAYSYIIIEFLNNLYSAAEVCF